MNAHKRSSSGLDDFDIFANKIPRMETMLASAETLASANARISDLEHQVKELHAFVNASGLAPKAPESIQRHMRRRPNAANSFAAQIETRSLQAYEEMEEKIWQARKSGVTSDDLSDAMMPFLAEVEELLEFPNSTVIAFDLVVALGGYSYGGLNSGGCGYGERPSDVEVDDLLVELAPERRKVEPSWNFVGVLESLKKQAKLLAGYGIEDFCAQTIKLLEEWKGSLPADVKSNATSQEKCLSSIQDVSAPLTH